MVELFMEQMFFIFFFIWCIFLTIEVTKLKARDKDIEEIKKQIITIQQDIKQLLDRK